MGDGELPTVESQIGIQRRDLPAVFLLVAVLAVALVVHAVTDDGARNHRASRGPAPVQHTVASVWTRGITPFRAIVVAPGTSDAEICALGRWLRATGKLPMNQFFDDGARVAEYVALQGEGDDPPWPPGMASWAAAHHRGIILPSDEGDVQLVTVRPETPLETMVIPCPR